MKWRWLFILALPVLAGLLAGCSGAGQSGTTAVTITIGSGKASSKAAYRPVVSKATATVASVTFSISGTGMDTVTRTVAITPPQTVTEVFNVLTGPARTILIEAKDGSGNIVYSGSTTMDLNGTPVTLTLPLQTMIFNRLITSPWNDESTAMVRAANGDLLVSGHTLGDLEGNVNADPLHGTFDVFVTRLSPTGARIWTRQFGTAGDDLCYGIAVDASGIYLAGSTSGALNSMPTTSLGPINAFVTKLSATGAHLWTRLTGTTGARTFGNAIAIDSSGNSYVTGDTDGSLGAPNQGLYDVFVTKLWTAQAGTTADDFSEGIAVNAAGTTVVITGSTRGALAGLYNGAADVYILAFDALTGALLTSPRAQFGTAADDDAWAVAIDVAGNVYVAGETSGSLSGANAGLSDLFVASYSPTGGQNWVKQFGTPGNDVANAITVDPVAGVVVTGRTGGDLQGAGSDGFDDSFTVLLDTNGNLLWTRQYGTRSNDDGIGVATDGSGNIWVIGNTFGGFTSSATEDIFLLRYDSNGNKVP
jgi:hypothetical protein